jgi:hypothetical protein
MNTPFEKSQAKLKDDKLAEEIRVAFVSFVRGRPYSSSKTNWDATRKLLDLIIPLYDSHGWDIAQEFIGHVWDVDLEYQPRWKTPIKRIKK